MIVLVIFFFKNFSILDFTLNVNFLFDKKKQSLKIQNQRYFFHKSVNNKMDFIQMQHFSKKSVARHSDITVLHRILEIKIV